MSEALISQREFARRLGVSEKTVRDGIKTGKISKGVIIENGKPKINFEIAFQESQTIGLGFKVLKQTESKKSPDVRSKVESKNLLDDLGVLSLSDALRLKENHNAKLKELELKKMEGSLLNKDEVFTQLFDFHQELRNALLAIPDRITDTLIAYSEDRNKVHQLINEAIASELDNLKRFADEI